MCKGMSAILEMEKVILAGDGGEVENISGTVFKFDKDNARIYLMVEKEQLTKISLDAIYRCSIFIEGEMVCSDGRIRDRYCCEKGNIVVFQINNGFYKIKINTTKSVDKQEA